MLGATDVALSVFKSYLEDREYVVSVLVYESVSSSLSCGVPQGSVLGPILRLLDTQPLSDIINRHFVLHHNGCCWYRVVQVYWCGFRD